MECGRQYLQDTYLDESLPEGVYVYIDVTDTGCGMDEETVKKIFDPFFTTKFIGRGLGLAAVLGIIRGHSGAIKVTSEVDKGTEFLALFPTSRKFFTTEKIKQGSLLFQNSGKILVVDDEDSVLSFVGRVLEREGYSVITASNGREAVEIFREHTSEISMIILDLTMPQMDGEQTFEELKKIENDVCVILSSGYKEDEAFDRFNGRGLAGFIQKPYQPEALLEKLKEVMGK